MLQITLKSLYAEIHSRSSKLMFTLPTLLLLSTLVNWELTCLPPCQVPLLLPKPLPLKLAIFFLVKVNATVSRKHNGIQPRLSEVPTMTHILFVFP